MKDQLTFNQQLDGLLRLTRWKEHFVFVIPLTVLGVLLAIRAHESLTLDWRIITVLLANLIGVTCGFMINDLEDAPDDALDPDRINKNPVSAGDVSPRLAYSVYWGLMLVSIGLYAITDIRLMFVSLPVFLASHLYSWRPVRLKSMPIIDVVSHSLLLGGYLTLAGYLAYNHHPETAWWIVAASAFGSVYGQFYNQLRDFETDKKAGLNTTSIVLGPERAKKVMYAAIGLAVICVILGIIGELFPYGLIFAILLGVAISAKVLQPSAVDMRGTEAIDASGSVQVQFWLVVNFTVGIWFIWAIINY